MKRTALRLARAAVIAALYFVFAFAIPSISFGAVQFRISEALCLLPAIMPEAALGLTVGCLLANLFSPFGILDIIIGTAVTLVASVLTVVLKKRLALAALPPVVLNAVFLPLIWYILGDETLYYINMLSVLTSQTVIIYGIGLPLTLVLRKRLIPMFNLSRTKKGNKEIKVTDILNNDADIIKNDADISNNDAIKKVEVTIELNNIENREEKSEKANEIKQDKD